MFQTVFSQYAARLGLAVTETGLMLTYVGLLSVFVQGFAVGRLNKRFSETQLIVFGAALMGLALFGWAAAWNVPTLLVVLAPTALAGGVLNTALSSSLTQAVYPEEVGGTLGLSASVESLTRVIAPTLGGFLLGALGIHAPGVAAGLLMIWVLSFAWRRLVRNPDPELPAPSAPLAGSTPADVDQDGRQESPAGGMKEARSG
jgi:DHA1 family tetracycline resistance protein-like MFS transporter